MINGEQVFDMPLLDLSLPNRLSDYSREQDWIGFYAYDDVPVVEVDCVAIYSYLVPEVVAKRRFVYGQGVDFPENLNTGYNGKSVYVDYKFSNYSNNYIYPDMGRWKQGVLENINARNDYLETPSYGTPVVTIDYSRSIITAVEVTEDLITYTSENSFALGEIITISGVDNYSFLSAVVESRDNESFSISNSNNLEITASTVVNGGIARSTTKKTYESFISANKKAQSEASPYIKLVPDTSWNNTYTYLALPSLNILNEPVEAFYAIFKSVNGLLDRQTLIRIENQASKDYFDISLVNGDTITYSIKYGESAESIIYEESGYSTDNLLQVGLNIQKASSAFGNAVRSFFGNKDALAVYFGGSPKLVDQFTGNLYKVGVSTRRNARKINDFFDDNGILINVSNVFNDYFQEDGITPIDIAYSGGIPSTIFVDNDSLVLDGGFYDSFAYPRVYSHIASYTFVPNSYLGDFVLDTFVDSYWHDYVPLKYFGKYVNDGATEKIYSLDYIQFNVDFPLIEKFIGNSYDTSQSNARFYVSFKYMSDRTNSDADFLTFTNELPKNNVIVPGEDWSETKYEVGNGTIIYTPENIDFKKIAMHIHVEYFGSSLENRKTKINTLSLAGNALNKNQQTEIGTRFGSPLVPVTKRGIYSDYRSRNPLVISKSSKPYLYLDDSTGIGLRPYAGNTGQRSIRVKINPNSQNLYRVGAMQLATKYSYDRFPSEPEQVFEITTISESIKFYVIAANESGTRGRVYALDDASKLPYKNITFYINGNSVKDAYIDVNTWSMLGFQFPVAINLDNDSYGEFAISGKMFVNNVLFYQVSAEENAKTRILRSWGQVRSMLKKLDDPATTEIDESLEQTYWEDFISNGEIFGDITSPVEWGTVLFIPTDRVIFIDPNILYMTYLGANKTIVGDSVELVIGDYQYRAYKDLTWQSSTTTPV